MLEGSANHCEYIHSPAIVQLLHFSNALGLIGIKQVLCQSWISVKKEKKILNINHLRRNGISRQRQDMSSACLLFSTVIASKRLKPLIRNGWQAVAESRRRCHLSTRIYNTHFRLVDAKL